MSGNKTKIEGTLNATGVAVVMAAAFRADPDGVFVATLTALKDTTNERDAAREELSRLTTPREMREWHEDFGDVLWWLMASDGPHEPPYCGSPLADDWPWEDYDDGEGTVEPVTLGGAILMWTPLPKVELKP